MITLCVIHKDIPYYLTRKNVFTRNKQSARVYIDEEGPHRLIGKWVKTHLKHVFLIEGSSMENHIALPLESATFACVPHEVVDV